MDVKFAVLADHASITREGKLNVLGIFDVINTPSLPVVLPVFFVVISYEAGAAEFDTDKNIEIVLTDEDGNILQRMKQVLHVDRPKMAGTVFTTNQLATIIGAKFDKVGSFQFDILVNGDSKQTVALRINHITQDK